MTDPRLFKLMRDTDITGVSGAGHVADGVVFGDGTVVMRWLSEHRSTAVYANLDDLIAIHGHDGATRVEFRGEAFNYESYGFKNAVVKIVGEELSRRYNDETREFARMMREDNKRIRSV
jgi:hypothetical protein